MNCPNCGTPVNATDTYCSFCGARVNYQPMVKQQPPASQTPISTQGMSRLRDSTPPKNNDDSKKNLKALVLSIIGILIAIALATGVFSYINHYNEESLWEECEAKRQINDLRTYIEKYPNGEHYDEAKKLLDKLVMDKEAWELARSSNDEEHLRDYIRNHPDSEHLYEARKILDDIVWNKTLAANTKDAYEQYIKEFPDGKHLADARSRFEDKQREELTEGECDNARSTIQNFLLALEEWDENLMLSTCNAEMSNFMGKLQASLNDVREYYEAYRESDIDSIGFTVPSIVVNKVIRNDRTAEYKVSFTTTRRMRRNSSEDEIVAVMKGQALLDDRFRFKELTLDKETQ